MRTKIAAGIGIVSLWVCMTGCGNAIPNMDEQQEKLVVEYMAGTLLKYDANRVSKLTQLPVEPEEDAALSEQTEDMPVENSDHASLSGEPENVEEPEAMEEPEVVSMDDFLGMEQASIQYTGYIVADYYPEQGEDLYFTMDASEGNKLLVLKFEITNTSMENIDVDMSQKNVRYKIRVNGDEKNALNTMLMNDLKYYQGVIVSGAREELVLAREIPAESENEIEVLELTMKNADDAVTILLD